MSAANLDVTVMVARAERRVLAAARAVHAAKAVRASAGVALGNDSTDDEKATQFYAARAAVRDAIVELWAEIDDLVAADEAAAACDQPVTDSLPVAATIAREAGEEV